MDRRGHVALGMAPASTSTHGSGGYSSVGLGLLAPFSFPTPHNGRLQALPTRYAPLTPSPNHLNRSCTTQSFHLIHRTPGRSIGAPWCGPLEQPSGSMVAPITLAHLASTPSLFATQY